MHRVLRHISEAAEIFKEARKAWDKGDEPRARNLYAVAEQVHCTILGLICGLSERDADLVEPTFTTLEKELAVKTHLPWTNSAS